MPSGQSGFKEKTRVEYREPKKFVVYIYNDDFTTMDFVVYILMEVFFKSETDAMDLMLRVHHSDKAAVGTYSYDIAKSKSDKAIRLARENGFPLKLTIEPENGN
ncbi:MAG: ATP-dependent Clp protease adaptor ClpS [Bacteroides sp.]|nr:ATP-dependent Clp protease adaptor ClpS [Bacteroides sp.]